MPVAKTFTFEDESAKSLSQFARLDTMLDLVDAKVFLRECYVLMLVIGHYGYQMKKLIETFLVKEIMTIFT